MKKVILAVLGLAVIGACAVTRVDPLTVPLVYKANPKNIGMLGGLSCNALSVQALDARTQKLLGTRVHESKPLKADVTAGGDPAGWVSDGVQSVLGQSGFSAQNGGPTLVVSLAALHSVESVWHRSSYEARITLGGEVRSRGGRSCWKGSADGLGENYGYSGSIPNYQETLNAALDSAVSNMAQAPGFKDAVCHCAD